MSTIPGHKFYGGATVMRLSDANGVPFMSCCTRKLSDGVFGFRIFKGAALEEVPLTPFCTGKGSMNLGGWWVAASDNDTWFNGPIPGFAPVTAHDARVDALISQLAAMSQTITQIETALGNISTEVLDPKDRTALDKLRAFLNM
jgi:hypothetical protein